MYVCICHGVTDKKIAQTVDNGAVTMKQLSEQLGVGRQCGKCVRCTKKVLNEQLIQIANIEPSAA